MALLDAGNRRHDLARRAIAALEGIMGEECRLDRMKIGSASAQAFDGGDRPAIDMHGTGATLALIAALLRAGEAHMLAQGIEQCDARLDQELMPLAVDFKLHGDGFRHQKGLTLSCSKGMTFRF